MLNGADTPPNANTSTSMISLCPIAFALRLLFIFNCQGWGVFASSPSVEEVFGQADSCAADDCGVSLLQRKATIRKPSYEDSDPSRQQESRKAQSIDSEFVASDDSFNIILADPLYISLLQSVVTFTGASLYEETENKSFPPSHLVGEYHQIWAEKYEYNFPNNALYTWGSKDWGNLYVFAPGTNALCTSYAAALSRIALQQKFFVVCPQISHLPSSQESIMKLVSSVKWAFSVGDFAIVALGGHSGGASAAPAAAAVLLTKNIVVNAVFMWHPGVVEYQNVPGCANNPCSAGGGVSPCLPANRFYCKEYFPSDLMGRLGSTKFLVIAGNFCEWTKVQNSNWYSDFACVHSDACLSKSFPSPSFRPEQPPVTCQSGCPNANFLNRPGDCMVATYSVSVKDNFFYNFVGEAVFVDSCGEHAYVTSAWAADQELNPYVLPFLKAVTSPQVESKALLEQIRSKDGEIVTCQAYLNFNENCLVPVTPYTTKVSPLYRPPNSTKDLLCMDAPGVISTGRLSVELKTLVFEQHAEHRHA